MAVNSVSSDFRRIYSSPQGLSSGAVVVRTVGFAPQVNPVSGDMASRDGRELAAQQQALISAVQELLSPQGASSVAGTTLPGAPDDAAAAEERAAVRDPILEQAILKFMHALFQSLKDVDAVGPSAEMPVYADEAGDAPGMRKVRSELGARLAELAQTLSGAELGSPPSDSTTEATLTDPPSKSESPAPPADSRLAKTYSDVMQILRGSGLRAELGVSQQAELSALVQRLAQAMQSTPALGKSFPTLGALLSARA